MSAKIEALPLPGSSHARRAWWIGALLVVLLVGASAGTYLVLRDGLGASTNVPGSVVAPSVAPTFAAPAAPVIQPAEAPAGPQIMELRDVGGLTSGTTSGPTESPSRSKGSSNSPSAPYTCRRIPRGPC